MQEERFALVLQSVEIIEKEIEKKTTPKNIKRIVIENMNYNDRHFDRIFFDILRYSWMFHGCLHQRCMLFSCVSAMVQREKAACAERYI